MYVFLNEFQSRTPLVNHLILNWTKIGANAWSHFIDVLMLSHAWVWNFTILG